MTISGIVIYWFIYTYNLSLHGKIKRIVKKWQDLQSRKSRSLKNRRADGV